MKNLHLNPITTSIRAVLFASVCSAPSVLLAQQNNVELEPITITGDYVGMSESVNRYTMPAMGSATGMNLSAKETPQAVTVVTNQRIRDQGAKSLRDAVNLSTGVTAQDQDAGRTEYAARGFEITRYSIDGQRVDFDKQYSNGEDVANIALFDRVEVVRGAVGLTDGSGNPSARINLVRKKADSTTPKTILSAGYGRWDRFDVTADHTQPLNASGSVRARVIASHQAGNSYVDLENRKNSTIYGTIGVDIGEQGVLNAGVSYQDYRRKSVMWGGLPVFLSDGSLADFPINTSTSADWVHWDSKVLNYYVDYQHTFANGWQAKVSAGHTDNSSELENVYWYGNVIDPATGSGPMSASRKYDDLWRKQNNIQVKLNGSFDAFGKTHDFVAGFDYTDNKTFGDMSRAAPSPMPNIYTWTGQSFPKPDFMPKTAVLKDMKEKESGLYAATRLRATDDLSFVLGTRVSNWSIRGNEFFTDIDDKVKSVWTPYAGVIYDLNDQTSLYASYTDSFQPQSNKQTKTGNVLKPLRAKNYELGLKNSFFDGAFNTQVSLFQAKQKNFPLNDQGQYVAGTRNPAYFTSDVTSKGFELEVNGQVTPELQLAAGYSQYKIKNSAGKEVNTQYPRKNFKLFATYDASSMLPGLTLGGGLQWMGSKYRDIQHVVPRSKAPKKYTRVEQGNVTLVNLMAKYQINPQFSAQLNIDNVFNKKYYSQVGMYDQLNYAPPRNIYAGLRYEF